MTDLEIMQKSLYYMDDGCGPYTDDYQKLIEAIRARLSQCERCGEVNPAEIHTCTPKQEPVAWWNGSYSDPRFSAKKNAPGIGVEGLPLYTAPPQREWQGLTRKQLLQIWGKPENFNDPMRFARAIEAKLKEKNA